jgi:hypothetical protein
MFNNSTPPKVVSFVDRFQQLSQLMYELPVPFVPKNGDSQSVWDITNTVCDRHHIEHSC